jgi:hypothetical protein
VDKTVGEAPIVNEGITLAPVLPERIKLGEGLLIALGDSGDEFFARRLFD